MNPTYSFVIPVRNGDLTLQTTLESIFAQTFSDYEVILVDNDSTDSSKLISEQFSPLTYLFEPIHGRSKARNAGAAKAQGKYLAFVDCDVILENEWLEKLNHYLENCPVDAICTSILPAFEKKEGVLDEFRYFFGHYKSHGTFLSVQKFFGVLPVINTAACIFLKKSFDELKGFNEEMVRDEDMELSIRMFCLGYNLGGTRSVTSKVRFMDKNRVSSYLKRSFEKSSLAINPDLPFSKVFFTLLVQAIKLRKINVLFFLFFLECFNMAGYLTHHFVRKILKRKHALNIQWKADHARQKLIFSFIKNNDLFTIKEPRRLIFVDEMVYCLDDRFRSHALNKDLSQSCLKLLKGMDLSDIETNSLALSGIFKNATKR